MYFMCIAYMARNCRSIPSYITIILSDNCRLSLLVGLFIVHGDSYGAPGLLMPDIL